MLSHLLYKGFKVLIVVDYEELCLLEYNAMQSGESQLMFGRNILPPTAWLKSRPGKKPTWSRQQAEPNLLPASHLFLA